MNVPSQTLSDRPGAPKPRRVSVLVSADAAEGARWEDWTAARGELGAPASVGLSRLPGPGASGCSLAAALRVGEETYWFAQVATPEARRLLLRHAASVSLRGADPANCTGLPVCGDPAQSSGAQPQGSASSRILFLTHAETDLLALEAAARRLPRQFPSIDGYSLNGLREAKELERLVGATRPAGLCVVARLHGRAADVPGLPELARLARSEGWKLCLLSGIEDADPSLGSLSTAPAELCARLGAYFMAGGAGNVEQGLLLLANSLLAGDYAVEAPRPMPAHGLYHPDWLVLSPEEWAEQRRRERPLAVVLFYRAHVLSGNLDFVDRFVRRLDALGFDGLGIFTSSLRDKDPSGMPAALRLLSEKPEVVFCTLGYPAASFSAETATEADAERDCFGTLGAPWLQAIVCGQPREQWLGSARGLSASETAVNVALPECDGRLIGVPISFKERHRYAVDEERLARMAGLGWRLSRLRRLPNAEKRVAIVLTNASGKAQKVGGAVGLDTPASLVRLLADLRRRGYRVGSFDPDSDLLMRNLLERGGYDDAHPISPGTPFRLARRSYKTWFEAQELAFKNSLAEAWGEPGAHGPTLAPVRWADAGRGAGASLLPLRAEPNSDDENYLFAGLEFGNVFVGIQPPRGFGMSPDAIYHSPDLPPSHHYAAFYRWLADEWKADAVIHLGKHGTLEWLPGKSVALSAACAPDVLLGDLPLFYPFVVNDPGEGAQAKRRAHATIVDHLVPPLTRAESYGPLAALSRLVEEYYRAEALDPAKLPLLQSQIWELVKAAHLEDDLAEVRRKKHGDHTHEWDTKPGESGAPRSLERLSGRGMAHLFEDLDAYLCELGRAQIRDGLHVFGCVPEAARLPEMLFAFLRCANGRFPSLGDALGTTLGLACDELRQASGLWKRPLPAPLADRLSESPTASELRQALDGLGLSLFEALGRADYRADSVATVLLEHGLPETEDSLALRELLAYACSVIVPALRRTGDETENLLLGLEGGYVPAGPSGAPSRGMLQALPTGRNFYSVDPRGLPSPSAWLVGQALAKDALERHLDEAGRFPENVALGVWGTATMRTGGDDVCQALAFLGVRPRWDGETRRTLGLEVIPTTELGRPRVDVTLRVSGFFRDAFPGLVQLVDEAVRLVAALDEGPELNFVRKHWLQENARLVAEGCLPATAARRASYRVFSSKPGAYGTGLLDLIESGAWDERADLAKVFLAWGGWAYGKEAEEGVEAPAEFRQRLSTVELALHNQDNREHDLFDSDDYFQFHGGLVATVAALSGRAPRAYFGDSSDPARPEIRTLRAEALRVFRSRVNNPKWQEAIRRHGYKGGLEMAATVDYLFGFSATADVVEDWMFEETAAAYAAGEGAAFLRRSNPWALRAISERLLEASQRGLWQAQDETLEKLRATLLEAEASLEGASPAQT